MSSVRAGAVASPMLSPIPDELHYSMVLEWDAEDAIYVVAIPELPGCQTHGRTYDEAVRQGQDAIASWVEAVREAGQPLPVPRTWSPRDEGQQS